AGRFYPTLVGSEYTLLRRGEHPSGRRGRGGGARRARSPRKSALVSSSCRGGRHRSHEGDDEREDSKSEVRSGALVAASGGRSRSGDIAGAPISVRSCPPSTSVSFDDGGPFDIDPGLALADRREATLAASHAPDQEGPDSDEDEGGTTQDASRVSQVFSRAPVKRTFAASSSRTRSGSQTSVATSAARGGTSCEVPSRVEQVRRALHDRGT